MHKETKPKINKFSRRKFLRNTMIASTIMIIPRHVLGGVGYLAPSDRLNLACIGCGGKGHGDILNASIDGNEHIVQALCDVDTGGSHGVMKTRTFFRRANFYQDFREMLDKEKNLDAVTISCPDHTHAVAAMDAMNRGLHVYVQKPLTHNIYEARLLTETARENKIITQMGNQGASNPSQKTLQNWIRKGKIGKISKVYAWTNRPVWPQGIPMPASDGSKKPATLDWDLWLGPAKGKQYIPNVHPFNWRGWWEFGTGAIGDMGCHLIDIPFKALDLGAPTDVECSVGSVYKKMWIPEYLPESCPPSSRITFHFNNNPRIDNENFELIWMDGGIKPNRPEIIPLVDEMGDKGDRNGVMIVGSQGIITAGVYGRNPKLYRKGKDPIYIEDKDSANEYQHQKYWVDAIKSGYGSDAAKALTSSFDYAGPLTEMVLLGNVALRSYLLRLKSKPSGHIYYGRKKLLWDWKNMKITNLDKANEFISRTYRKGWEL